MFDTPVINDNLQNAAAALLDAIREGANPTVTEIAILAAKGYHYDAIGTMVCGGILLVLGSLCALFRLNDNHAEISGFAAVIFIAVGAVMVGCSIQGYYAPETLLATKLIFGITH